MFKKWLWASICIMALSIGSVVNAADMEAILDDSTSSTGFSIKDNNENTLMRVQGDGNVGIGTASPGGTLDIRSDGPAVNLLIGNATADGNGKAGRIGVPHFTNAEEPMSVLLASSDSGTNSLFIGGGTSLFNAATDIHFYTATNSTTQVGTERMAITNNGNVGIGTTAPVHLLHLFKNDSSTSPSITIEQAGTGDASMKFLTTQDEDWVIGQDTSDSNSFKVTHSSSLGNVHDHLTIKTAGNVGIGTTAPAAKLHVAGDIIHTGSISQGSSRELKKDISYISDKEAMSALESMRPVKYKYKADNAQEEHLGFIAEDVPELVANQDRKTLSSMNLTALLTKVVQEQQKMLQEQKEAMAAMKQEMQMIKSAMNYGVKGL